MFNNKNLGMDVVGPEGRPLSNPFKELGCPTGKNTALENVGELPAVSNREALQETADTYWRITVILSASWRIIECRDSIQWILQRRKKGGAERPWRAVGYFRTRKALTRVCATFNQEFDPGALIAPDQLPELFGRSSVEV